VFLCNPRETRAIKFHPHVASFLLIGLFFPIVRGKAEVATDGGWETAMLENCALDLGGVEAPLQRRRVGLGP